MDSPRTTEARDFEPVAYCYRELDCPVLWRVGGRATEAGFLELLMNLESDPDLELLWFEVAGERVEVNPVPSELRSLA